MSNVLWRPRNGKKQSGQSISGHPVDIHRQLSFSIFDNFLRQHVVPVIATRRQNGALPRIVALAKRQSDIALIGVDLFYPDCPLRSLFVFIVRN